ncbi:carbohydrate-binding family 9-like protein [Eubacteriales bacterium OttesenSCG-928-M02]|nr:carbohydrate-binding family 9-like protein [Eubacteriales bacterium OttesenSCG-928-M02]
MKSYTIKRVADGSAIDWQGVEKAEITLYADTMEYRPTAWFRLCHDGENLYVYFHAEEPKIVAQYKNYNDPVSMDSCAEFFLNPFPDVREDYMNFETSVLGTLLLGFGYIRPRGRLWHILPADLQIEATVKDPESYNGEYWELKYTVPFAMLQEVYGATGLGSGHKMRGNFYKICSSDEMRHAGTWNETPGFHDRSGFGELVLE